MNATATMTTTTTKTTKKADEPPIPGHENPHGLRFDESEDTKLHFDSVVKRFLLSVAPRGISPADLTTELRLPVWRKRNVVSSLKRLSESEVATEFEVDGVTYFAAPREGQEPYIDQDYGMADSVATLYAAICGVFAPRTIRRRPLTDCVNARDDR